MSPYADANQILALDFMLEDDTMMIDEPIYKEDVTEVLHEWTSDTESIMQVDQEIGSDFLSDDLLGITSTGADDFFALEQHDDDEQQKKQAAFLKLQAMMKKSQETRAALTMKCCFTPLNNQTTAKKIQTILSNVTRSQQQIHSCFTGIAA